MRIKTGILRENRGRGLILAFDGYIVRSFARANESLTMEDFASYLLLRNTPFFGEKWAFCSFLTYAPSGAVNSQ